MRKQGKERIFGVWNKFHIGNLARLSPQGPTILFYHGVVNKMLDEEIQTLHHEYHEFDAQIKYLKDNREIISLGRLFEGIMGREELNSNQIVITFDDGLKNNRDIVEPILTNHGIRPAIFICTRNVDEEYRYPTYQIRTAILHTRRSNVTLSSIGRTFELTSPYERRKIVKMLTNEVKTERLENVERLLQEVRALLNPEEWSTLNLHYSSDEPMSWSDVKSLAQAGWEIGSHCHDHLPLHRKQNPDVVRSQLEISKGLIEKHIGSCRYFSYPNGDMDSISVHAREGVRDAGYDLGLSAVAGDVRTGGDRFLLPRRIAPRKFEHFKMILSNTGYYNNRYIEWINNYNKKVDGLSS